MIEFTLQQVMDAIHPVAVKNIQPDMIIRGVQIDSRKIVPGNLFVPMVGQRANGHDFVVSCIQQGAVASLWEEGQAHLPEDVPLLIVKDSTIALGELAKAYRETLDTTIIGVTGSSGKTSTKDIIASVSSVGYVTQKTQGNQNNEIGLPLTILSLEKNCQVAVIEMGIDDFNQMEYLGNIAQPNVAVITSVSESHIDNMKTIEAIAHEKYQITNHLRPNGAFFYNGDYELLHKEYEKNPIPQMTKTFGFNEHEALHVLSRNFTNTGVDFKVNAFPEQEFHLNLLGDYEVSNAMAAILCGISLGLTFEEIQQGFSQVQLTDKREDVREFGKGLLIDGTYNSNPGSLAAALKMLVQYPTDYRKIAVLGDMYGLGEQTLSLHQKIGKEVNFQGIDEIWTVGEYAPEIGWEAAKNYPQLSHRVFENKEALKEGLKELANQNVLFLVKASRAVALDEVLKDVEEQL